MDTYPAMFLSETFPLIVVGAVNNAGRLAEFSQGPNFVTTWAPGDGVVCAQGQGRRQASDISFSTGMVS